MTAALFAIQALQLIPSLISAGIEIKGLVDQTRTSLEAMQAERRDPSQAEWDALNDTIKSLRTQLHG